MEKKRRLITVDYGTSMGDDKVVVETDAPEGILRELEKESCQVYIDGGDYEDVPDWRERIQQLGYVFLFVDSHPHVTAYASSTEWKEDNRIYNRIREEYVIENQPYLYNN